MTARTKTVLLPFTKEADNVLNSLLETLSNDVAMLREEALKAGLPERVADFAIFSHLLVVLQQYAKSEVGDLFEKVHYYEMLKRLELSLMEPEEVK